jgi:hypothetical protein
MNQSKMGGNKEKKRRPKATKSNRGIRKPKGPYASLDDRFSSPPEGEGMDISTTRKTREPEVHFANVIKGRRTRTQTAIGNQYREQKEIASRRSETRRQHKDANRQIDDLAEMFGERTRLGV